MSLLRFPIKTRSPGRNLVWSAVCLFTAVATAREAGHAPAGPNILLLCVDDLRPDIGAFGVGHAITPHIDRLAAQSRIFTRHYVQAPTCGASRFTLLTGLYGPANNDALMRRAAKPDRKPSLPEVFRNAGYTTAAVGKVSHHPGGLAGKNWNDTSAVEMPGAWDAQPLPCGPWRHPEGLMHGLANGAIRSESKQFPALQAVEGPDTIYPDGLITRTALGEVGRLAKTGKPFFLAVGWIRPHLPFGMPKRYLDMHVESELPPIPHPAKPDGKTTWHPSGEFFRYHHGGRKPGSDSGYADEVRRHYAASVTYADAQVGIILAELERLKLDRNTVIVLWGDHGWHLGEHAVWGKHTLFEESLRSPLIIHVPGMASPGAGSAAVVETLDVFPTLCALAGIEPPGFLHGKSLRPVLNNPDAPGHTAVSYFGGAETLRTDRHRLIRHRSAKQREPYYELYDHQSPEGETRNIAEQHPDLVRTLGKSLDERLSLKLLAKDDQ